MRQRGRGAAGFSLVEMMVVVSIIGILSSLALPTFQRFLAKAKQSEPKTNIPVIYTLQEMYQGDNGTYANDLSLLSFAPGGHVRYYYGTNTPTATTYWVGAMSLTNTGYISSRCPTEDGWWYDNVVSTIMSGTAYSTYLYGSPNIAYGVDCSVY